MRSLLLFMGLFLLCTGNASSQQPDSIWTLRVDSVLVQGKTPDQTKEASVGIKVTSFSKALLQSHQAHALSELLSDNSTVYIKSLGQGAMSTASFRGTAASHTKVNWNGITLNPSMSNTFDFSQLPIFFTDDVTLYHGSGHLKNGTGGLGGSVNVSNRPDWNDTTKVRAFAEVGSYDTYTGAASVRLKREKALYRTRLYYKESENNYKYLNKIMDPLQPTYERRQEAAYHQAGVMQEAYFRPDTYSTVSSGVWLMFGERELPQNIGVNITQHETYRNSDLNAYVGYDQNRDKHFFSVKAAYLYSDLKYHTEYVGAFFGEKRNNNRMQSLQVKGDYTYTSSSRLELGAVARFSYENARTHSTDSVRQEDGTMGAPPRWNVDRKVGDLGAFVRWKPAQRVVWDAQAMGELNDDDFAPTFSTGAVWDILPGHLSLKAVAAYNYKIPSLNDRYWLPGGNPNLGPEKGYSYDATLTYTDKFGESFYVKSEVTAYRMDIKNWIMWLPQNGSSVWRPVNFNDVLSQGIEALLKFDVILPSWKFALTSNYTYNRSEYQNQNFQGDKVQYKQVPYVPVHQANGRLSAEWAGICLSYWMSYTAKRYTTQDQSYETPAYTIHNAELSYAWRIGGKYLLTPKFSMDNLFDAYYESTQYYPMPLRSFLFSLSFSF